MRALSGDLSVGTGKYGYLLVFGRMALPHADKLEERFGYSVILCPLLLSPVITRFNRVIQVKKGALLLTWMFVSSPNMTIKGEKRPSVSVTLRLRPEGPGETKKQIDHLDYPVKSGNDSRGKKTPKGDNKRKATLNPSCSGLTRTSRLKKRSKLKKKRNTNKGERK